MRRPTSRRRRRAAFTLMEVLLVVAILLILASIVAVSFSGIFGGAQEDTAKANLEELAKGVQLFWAQHKTPPGKLEDLVQEPSGLKRKWSPILDRQKIPLDPWESPFVYEQGQDGKTFTLSSPGPDKQANSADDIKVTKRY